MSHPFQPIYDMAETNLRALELLSAYLNGSPRGVQAADVKALSTFCGIPEESAYAALVCAACGVDGSRSQQERILEKIYFPGAIHCMDDSGCCSDPYYQHIHMPEIRRGQWELGYKTLQPYECFPSDDIRTRADGRELPQAGYFTHAFRAPVVKQNGREWMTVTPSERNTMLPHVDQAFGNVVVFGLGLGYYPYMVLQKENVKRVTVVEKDGELIRLFRQYLLDQFPRQEDITIEEADAFDYARHLRGFDCAYVDLWHDVSDGAAMYIRMKRLEKAASPMPFMYWIEPSILAFIRSLLIYDHQTGQSLPPEIARARDADALRIALADGELRRIAAELPLSLVTR